MLLQFLLLATASSLLPFDVKVRGLIERANVLSSVRAAVEEALPGANSLLDESFFEELRSRHAAAPEDEDLRAVINAYGEIYTMPELVQPHSVDKLISRHWTTFESDEEAELVAIDNHLGTPAAGFHASGYGEITRDGSRALYLAMGLTARRASPAKFYDLGSGYGRLVAQCWLELAPKAIIDRAVGVELATTRYNAAVRAWDSVCASGDAPCSATAGGPEFILGSMLETDLSEATHVFLCSPLFDNALLDAVWQVLLRDAPQLELVASLRKFPNAGEPAGVVKVSMNWNDSCPVYLYRFGRGEL